MTFRALESDRASLNWRIRKEWDDFATNVILTMLNLLGPGALGNTLRAKALTLFGYRIGKGAKVSTQVVIHSRCDDLAIGEKTFINKRVFFDCRGKIRIGKGCDIGFNSVFTTTQHTLDTNFEGRRPSAATEPIIIEDYVWLGCNVTVLGGVTIGRGSVVAAGSVVTKDIPPNTLAMGVPAKPVRTINQQAVSRQEAAALL